MRPIGGELESKKNDYNSYSTDSGRSSLRLFLRSGENNKKRYLIPNFFCEVIEKVFIEESIDYAFYNISDDLTIDLSSIEDKNYDAFYLINYFGAYIDISKIELDEKILLEDNVFMYDFSNRSSAKKWYAFNSFRKITALGDGSLIKTNLPIDVRLIENSEAIFSEVKYKAKDIKYQYLNSHKYTENDYLNRFVEGEMILDKQSKIYRMSNKSIEKLCMLNRVENQKLLKERYMIMIGIFQESSVILEPIYYSFFILKLKDRDKLMKELMDKGIFLAVHWLKSTVKNKLYNEVISIPLFANYSDDEFDYLIKSIKDVL